jgi:hypothetical protein
VRVKREWPSLVFDKVDAVQNGMRKNISAPLRVAAD